MIKYESRHLIAAHEVVKTLQQDPRISIEQIHAKDIIAAALAGAERGEWRRKFARVVFLGNNVAPLSTDERAELNALLSEAYGVLKELPDRAAAQ